MQGAHKIDTYDSWGGTRSTPTASTWGKSAATSASLSKYLRHSCHCRLRGRSPCSRSASEVEDCLLRALRIVVEGLHERRGVLADDPCEHHVLLVWRKERVRGTCRDASGRVRTETLELQVVCGQVVDVGVILHVATELVAEGLADERLCEGVD